MARPYRVLAVDHHQDLAGGGEVVLLRLLSSIDRGRFHVTVSCLPGGSLARRLNSLGVPLLPLRARSETVSTNVLQEASAAAALRYVLKGGAELVSLLLQIRGQIRRGRFDLVYTNSLKSCVLCAAAARGTGAAMVHHMHDICDPSRFSRPLLGALRWALQSGADMVIAVSGAVAESLRSLGVPAEKIRVVHNGVSLEEYPLVPRQQARRRTGLSTGGPLVGHVARLMRWKGQDFFLRSAARVPGGPRFVLAGGLFWEEREYEKELRRLAAQAGLADRVAFLGHRQDVPDLMRAFDVLAHTSLKPEPFGLAIIEAMAAETPVVAFRAGGVPEIVVDGETGILTPPGDEEAFAEALAGLLADPARARRMGKAGRERVELRFTMKRQSAKLQQCFVEVLAEQVR